MSRRRASAFTLAELLVVVGIIGLLVSILLPWLSAARELARATNCQAHLQQIGAAFHAAEGQSYEEQTLRTRYPPHTLWPAVPLNVGLPTEVFHCPDEAQAFADTSSLQFRSQELWFVNFEPGPYCIVTEGNGYTDYAFEDLAHGDFDIDDVHVRIYHGTPERLEIHKTGSAGFTNNSIFYRGEELITDASHKPGASFLLTGGLTNYGINAQVARAEVAPRTLVVLDYDQRAANNGEDMSVHLEASRRHLGKLNVLLADESVHRMGPSRLDPAVGSRNADLWSPDR